MQEFNEVFFTNLSDEEKNKLLQNKEGFILGEQDGRLMRLDKDGDPIFTFSTDQENRENRVAIPNMLMHEGSALSVSVGPRTVKETLSYRRDVLGQTVHVFDPYGVTNEQSCSINLMDELSGEFLHNEASHLSTCLLRDELDEAPSVQEAYDRRHPRTLQRTMLMAADEAQKLLAATILYVKTADEVPSVKRNFGYCGALLNSYGEEWVGLMSRYASDDGVYSNSLNWVGNFLKNEEAGEHVGIARDLASSSVESFYAGDKLTEHSSFKLSDLRNDKTTLYVVMPDYDALCNNKKWVRALIECAEDACPDVINTPDRHHELKQSDRILFMIDGFEEIGRLNSIPHGLHSAFVKGVTYWGMMNHPSDLVDTYGQSADYIQKHNPNMHILHVQNDRGGRSPERYDDKTVLNLVKKQIITSAPRPSSKGCSVPFYRKYNL